jgi:hypothetical protein
MRRPSILAAVTITVVSLGHAAAAEPAQLNPGAIIYKLPTPAGNQSANHPGGRKVSGVER